MTTKKSKKKQQNQKTILEVKSKRMGKLGLPEAVKG